MSKMHKMMSLMSALTPTETDLQAVSAPMIRRSYSLAAELPGAGRRERRRGRRAQRFTAVLA